jgi:hypothetical protein
MSYIGRKDIQFDDLKLFILVALMEAMVATAVMVVNQVNIVILSI